MKSEQATAGVETPADQEGELMTLRKVMFDLLRRDGYDRVELEYESEQGEFRLQDVTFHKGSRALPGYEVPAEVGMAVLDYVCDCIPTEAAYTRFYEGSVRIYTASEYTCFRHYAETEDYFWDGGEPGAEVPEGDIYPLPGEEERLAGYCDLCRAKEIELFGTVLNTVGLRHKRACREAGCGHPTDYDFNTAMRLVEDARAGRGQQMESTT